ncbi:MAG: MFS transporter [Actinomycetaceae bacterium]|nr:MFS transporter [Arcanobacterium sp.]MDD7504830.1 MFS transporter [Actinomycetaceae bacterium]MDY6143678.1 MFS transporter [Arcanobacterium sp.]
MARKDGDITAHDQPLKLSSRARLGDRLHLHSDVRYSGAKLERWLTILSVIFISIAAFEVIAVSTAMPYVVEDLDGKRYYALASGIALASQLFTTAIAGLWSDAKGPKPVLYTGISLFTVGLLMATFAPTIEWLILGRAIQGLGAGLQVVPLYVFIGRFVEPDHQPRVFAALAAAWVLPSLIGPMIAGFLVEYVHWRWVFGASPLLIVLFLPFTYAKFRHLPSEAHPKTLSGMKTAGVYALLAAIAVAALQMTSGLTADDFNLGAYLRIAVFTVVTVLTMRKLLPAGTFVVARGIPATVMLRGILNGSLLTVEIYLPLLLKEVHGWSPTAAGTALTVGSITWAVGSLIQGKISNPVLRRKLPVVCLPVSLLGMAITACALIPGVGGWPVLAGWFVANLGVGTLYPALTVWGLSLTPEERQGQTSSALQLADTVGLAALVAYGGIVYALALPLGRGAFALLIALMFIVMANGLWVARRLQPRGV